MMLAGNLSRFQDGFARSLFSAGGPAHPVYRNTVLKGCVDALQANFPAVTRLVGEDWFRAAAVVYTRRFPPQAPVLVANLLAAIDSRPLSARYDGYAACPIPTDYGKLLLCEFDYDLKPSPTFPLLDGTKEQRLYWWLKRYGLPALYWNGMLKGLG